MIPSKLIQPINEERAAKKALENEPTYQRAVNLQTAQRNLKIAKREVMEVVE